MRVDELNDDTEAKLDALENRTRALAARVDALTKERDTARASSDRWHGVAHRMEAERDAAKSHAEGCQVSLDEAVIRREEARMERDAAVKAKEEAEVSLHVARKQIVGQAAMLTDLRAQLVEAQEEIAEQKASFDLRWQADQRAIAQWQTATGKGLALPDHADLCVWLLAQLAEAREREGRYREALETIAESHDAGRHDGLPEECPAHEDVAMWSLARAALSPSPVTFDGFMAQVQAEAEREGPEAVAESEAWGKHFAREAAALSPSPASGVVVGEVLPPETYPKWQAGGWGPATVDGEVARKSLPASGVMEEGPCVSCRGTGVVLGLTRGAGLRDTGCPDCGGTGKPASGMEREEPSDG